MRDIQRRYASVLRRVGKDSSRYIKTAERLNQEDHLSNAPSIVYQPSPNLANEVRRVAEIENELVCRHKKYMWHVCPSCHRDKQQAEAYRVYLKKRIKTILS